MHLVQGSGRVAHIHGRTMSVNKRSSANVQRIEKMPYLWPCVMIGQIGRREGADVHAHHPPQGGRWERAWFSDTDRIFFETGQSRTSQTRRRERTVNSAR